MVTLVNKRELARILGMALPTVSAWVDRYPDFPVVEHGTNGREWQFDPVAVRAFVDATTAAEEAAETARAEVIAQLALPMTDPGDAATGAPMTLETIKTIKAADDLRLQRGFLVSVPETRQALTAEIARWNRSQRAVVDQVARDFNLPDAVKRAMADRLADAQRQFVNSLREAHVMEGERSERLIA